MDKFTDQEYLKTQQYRNASNLYARMALHEHFSTNRYNWLLWVFDHLLHLPKNAYILELGCGPCTLWTKNAHRIPAGWNITLTDLSPGMLDEARRNLASVEHRFQFRAADAQNVPFEESQFDAVIANHMLYHVPDRLRAFAEIRRVLRQNGELFAATNGQYHMQELYMLIKQFVPNLQEDVIIAKASHEFGLENGAKQLSKWFMDVKLIRYEDSLEITEAEPLLAYTLSMISLNLQFLQPNITVFRAYLEKEIETKGSIHISKSAGLFTATKS